MKKIIFIISLIIISTNIEAQNSNSSFGVRAGANLSKIRQSEGNNVLPGFTFGMFYNYAFNKIVSMDISMMYTQQNIQKDGYTMFHGQENFIEKRYDIKKKYQYLNFPILVKFNVFRGLNIYVGPQLDVNLYVRDMIGGSYNHNDTELFKPVNMSIIGGMGYNFTEKISLNVDYNYGCINSADTRWIGGDAYYPKDSWRFTIGYKF